MTYQQFIICVFFNLEDRIVCPSISFDFAMKFIVDKNNQISIRSKKNYFFWP